MPYLLKTPKQVGDKFIKPDLEETWKDGPGCPPGYQGRKKIQTYQTDNPAYYLDTKYIRGRLYWSIRSQKGHSWYIRIYHAHADYWRDSQKVAYEEYQLTPWRQCNDKHKILRDAYAVIRIINKKVFPNGDGQVYFVEFTGTSGVEIPDCKCLPPELLEAYGRK